MIPSVSALALAVQAGAPVLAWGAAWRRQNCHYHGGCRGPLPPLAGNRVGFHLGTSPDFSGLPVIREDGSYGGSPQGRGFISPGRVSSSWTRSAPGPPAVQAALLRVVSGPVVGDLPLPGRRFRRRAGPILQEQPPGLGLSGAPG